MPLVGTRDVTPALADTPLLQSLDTDPWLLQGASILHVIYEIDQAQMVSLLPPALHPTIPPTIYFSFLRVPESSVGPFVLGEARIGCRSALRPRSFLVRAYCDNPAAIAELRSRWGFPVALAEVSLHRYYDRAHGVVVKDGETVLDVELRNPEPISGADIQYLPNVNLARVMRDGSETARLIQVDPDYVFAKADRGKPHLNAFAAPQWGLDNCRAVWPVSASFATADVTMPKLRYIVDPTKPPMQSVEHI